ncbi:7TMR-DISM family protein [Hyunsoonleella ulvae]|uniref:7TMR-DISM family protein n=1 Tax=Hyunsoonleella ulvae TaxID=2799948 RepID=UPI0019396B09|nr:7TM diverse intracellular signaling domain-containing protein [Hyunsoonleella ulvae]
MRLLGLTCILTLLSTYSVYTQNQELIPLEINKISRNDRIGHAFQYYYTDSILSIEEVKNIPFKPAEENIINLGFSTGTHWLKFRAVNTSSKPVKKLLQILKPLQDSIIMYHQNNNAWASYPSGMMIMEDQKAEQGASLYFPIELASYETKTYYLKARSKYGKWFMMHVIDKKQKERFENRELLIVALIIGALLTIALYNLFIGIGLRDSLYIYYAIAIICSLSAQITVRGFSKQFLIDEYPFMLEWFPPLSIALGIITLCIFCIKFLNIKTYSTSAYWGLMGLIYFQIGSFLYEIINMEVFGNYTTNKLVAMGTFASGFIALYAGVKAYLNGNKFARYFIGAWIVYCFGISLYAGTLLQLLPVNKITGNAYVVGSFLEVLLLSFALAERYNILQKEKFQLTQKLNIKDKDIELKKQEIIQLMSESVQLLKNKAKLAENLKKLSQEEDGISLKSILTELRSDSFEDSKSLFIRENIESEYSDFMFRIKEKHPKLTKLEVEMATYSIMGLTRKEAATLRGTSVEAVKSARARLKKKLNLAPTTTLEQYFKSL